MCYGADLIRGSGSDIVFVREVVNQKHSPLISFPYRFYWTSTDDAMETSENVSKYRFYMRDSQHMKVTSNKRNHLSSKLTSWQNRKKVEGQGGEDLNILDVHVTEKVAAMSVESGTAANVRVSNLSDCNQLDLFLRIEHIKNRNITLRDATLLHVTTSRASFWRTVSITPVARYQQPLNVEWALVSKLEVLLRVQAY